ncbi:terminase large subunit [Herbidospora mongoliensis]|uniref:terminase large subunit n=1 Tax=Herbidospora mongoliensis TaxID=688067 RepID=UPI000B2566CF|nr:terminase TerL endonuclease subunit [Herbidospora mongoliensis]
MTRRRTSSPERRPPDHNKRWRPADRKGPVCGFTLRGLTCEKKGAHYCEPRADKFVLFCAELLVHTKGPHRRKPFILRFWQEHEIARPLFGEVVWSAEWERYVRRYRIAHIVVARKNGKSEIAAAIQLYMLVGDDEEFAEVYSAAKDMDQAAKVFEPAVRMVQLSPLLRGRLRHMKDAKRLVDEKSHSHYGVITSDAEGELGHNPHSFGLDEVLSQPDGSLWTAMTTAAGAREQELMFSTTTETNDSASFGAGLIDDAERVQEDPKRAPHVFAFVRKSPRTPEALERLQRIFAGHPDLPVSCDPYDERNWKWPNPALDDFKSRDALRRQALEARGSKMKENGFLQFQMNCRVQQVTRYISLDLWDACIGEVAPNPEWILPHIEGRKCWGGLDLSSRLDLTSLCFMFDNGWVWWRFWAPEAIVPVLDEHTDNQFSQWVDDGWVELTDGDTIDYDAVYDAVEEEHLRFRIADITYDKWTGEPVRQEIEKRTGLTMYESNTTYDRMTDPMKELSRLLKAHDGEFLHGGNPVARWMADNLEAKSPVDDPERLRPVKPNRDKTGKRIDGMITLLYGIDARRRAPGLSIYETRGLTVL